MKTPPRTFLLVPLLALAGLFLASGATRAADRPNIVFIFSDDHAPNAISSYPGGIYDEVAPTPNIDRIAREGLLFENSFCTNSICGPSRASILTGKHSHLNGFIDNNSSLFDGLQQTHETTLRVRQSHTALLLRFTH